MKVFCPNKDCPVEQCSHRENHDEHHKWCSEKFATYCDENITELIVCPNCVTMKKIRKEKLKKLNESN